MADVDMNQGHQQAELQAAIKAAFDELIRAGLPPNEAAAQALIRAQDALRNSKMAEPVAAESEDAGEIQKEKDAHMNQEAPKSDAEVPREQTEIITVEGIRQCLQQGLDQPDEAAKYRPLIHFIGRAFASPASLNSSFPPHIESMEVEGEEMKASEETLNIDIEEVAEVYKLIAEQEHEGVLNSLSHAFESLLYNQQFTTLNLRSCLDLRQFLVVFECPLIMDPSYKLVLASLFQCLIKLPKESQEHIQNWLARQARERLGRYVAATQQYITLRVYLESVEEARPAVAVLGLLWAANGGGGGGGVLPAKAFHNDAINAEVFDRASEASFHEYMLWREDRRAAERRAAAAAGRGGPAPPAAPPVSLVSHPFVLDAASKAVIIQLDSRVKMRQEMDHEVQSMLLGGGLGQRADLYLVLRVHRDNIVQTTLQALAMHPDEDLRKPLKVQFAGEEGIDEGGVQKEFFQVVLRELLDPNYGMFVPDPQTKALWFNKDSLEAALEFELVGTLLGVAIYNAVIVDVHFPSVVYKKLEGLRPTLEDLKEAQPELGKNFQRLLDLPAEEVAALGFTFELSFEVFGELRTHELKPGGAALAVTAENRAEYVRLYVGYVLTEAVAAQFDAFRRGFLKVCGGAALDLFSPEDVELLLCGNPVLDFTKLEKATIYEDGFTADSPTVRFFWEVVHGYDENHKKALLKFATGSDRAPINGLESLTFVVSRNGDDSDRLPTAHTCFNHLLLPGYRTREKLADRLTKAIEQSEGFGLR